MRSKKVLRLALQEEAHFSLRFSLENRSPLNGFWEYLKIEQLLQTRSE